jgi:hypothetical protein
MQHARVAIYTLTSGTVAEVARTAEQGMLPIFAEQPDFIRHGVVTYPDHIVSINIWETEAEAEAANTVAPAWVGDNLARLIRLEASHVGDLPFFSSVPALV